MRWARQPKIWRFVCFISSVVGFLCYALSSSFNHLFGNWNLLKISLFTVFGLLICLTILFARTSHTFGTSLPYKTHLVFLVFAISTVYSFFFDKANGKPDLYCLIYVAFAIMSLCLSKQTHFGFEVDLLYFFCGCLTLQLMKIKLFLVIVGLSFSYSLIILRFYLSYAIEGGNLGLQIQDQHSLVIQVHADLEESNTAAENAHPIDIQPQEVIYSESPPIMNSNAFQENAHLIVPQETMNSESVPIMNFVTLQENTHLSMPQEAIHSESSPIMNAAQENEEITQVSSQLQHNIARLNKQRSITSLVKEKERGGIASLVKKFPFGAKPLRALRKSMMHTSKSLSPHD
ncbi:uncharacterized protein LOC123923498 [Trifolium pratense]|uniref:uncharacterized protein LOC123923498 n=1 Tax=Trifolium pratense TaxID=57577 RepID=UPI001E697058|nr:uncharacterized protein LOC123923498 [Trifolium pratense]